MNQISSWSIKNPIPIILLFIILTLAGSISFAGMRINNNPDIDFPLVAVSAARPGAAPAEMEVQVTRLIEDSITSPVRRAPHLLQCGRRLFVHHHRIRAGHRHRARHQ